MNKTLKVFVLYFFIAVIVINSCIQERVNRETTQSSNSSKEALQNTQNTQHYNEDGFIIENEGNGIKIIEYTGSKTEVIIPSRIQNLPVTSIGDRAFAFRHYFTSVTIPNSVTSIGDCAFYPCSLVAINVVADNTAYTSENGVLYNKNKTTLIAYPVRKANNTFVIPNGVTKIEKNAFSQCTNLTSIIIPDSVTNIGEGAFYYTNLINITLPNSVTFIGNNAFNCCENLSVINVNNANTVYSSENGILYNKAKTTLIKYPDKKTDSTFIIPKSVTTIGDSAFYCCYNLIGITVPNSVTSIGDNAFSGCYNLIGITIPNGVTAIGNNVFSNCSSLSSITIPKSVTSIGDGAFSRCFNLTSVTFQGTIPSSGFFDENNSNYSSPAFPGDLRDKFYKKNKRKGTPGTYTRQDDEDEWTKIK